VTPADFASSSNFESTNTATADAGNYCDALFTPVCVWLCVTVFMHQVFQACYGHDFSWQLATIIIVWQVNSLSKHIILSTVTILRCMNCMLLINALLSSFSLITPLRQLVVTLILTLKVCLHFAASCKNVYTSDLVVGGRLNPPTVFSTLPAFSMKFVCEVDSNPPSSLTQAIRSKYDSITE